MSSLYTLHEHHENMNMFAPETLMSRPHSAPEAATPPAKRRRGRPSRCGTEMTDGSSPAAHLSATVQKQGTPKSSAPLMRISPVKSQSSDTSPFQRRVNPSPKGGTLMRLDGSTRGSAGKSAKSKKNSFYRMMPHTISLHTQQNIQSLTADHPAESRSVSVNPSLLLSSPISSSKISELNKSRLPPEAKNSTAAKPKKMSSSQTPTFPLSSSPMTPTSCFSSIMQSSPLYQGFYQSSPGTAFLGSSPAKLQLRPMELPTVKVERPFSVQNLEELPTNPSNSPTMKPTTGAAADPSPKSLPSSAFDQYRLSMSIDENGMAKITKTFKGKPPKKIMRHQSMINVSSLQSQSLKQSFSNPSLKAMNQEFSLYVEPSKVTSDSFFSEFDEQLGLGVTTPAHQQLPMFANGEEIDDDDDDADDGSRLEDESMNFDARRALMKMIRRSI